ncbi:unnamed protein product [Musa acuminata subsp. burmannicoides]
MVLGGGAAGDYSSGSMATLEAAVAEEDMVGKDYVGISEVSSSSYPGSAGVGGGMDEEEELELGLSLGTKKAVGGGGTPWADYCRILTAEDLPSMGSRASPLSSSSSVSSSSSPIAGGERCNGSVAKKTFSNPPSQMVVGWPPIRAYRMNSLVNQSKENTSAHATITSTRKKASQNIKNNKTGERICCKEIEKKGRSSVNSLFVKVNLDGDPIGRKVDLSSYPSYETLALALEAMFLRQTLVLGSSIYDGPRTSKLLDGSSGFIITYEDRDGDWMLVGDVPWGMFLSTVKRLRIMKTSDASGLGKFLQPTYWIQTFVFNVVKVVRKKIAIRLRKLLREALQKQGTAIMTTLCPVSCYCTMSSMADQFGFFSRRCVWVNGPIIVGAGPSGLAVAACLKEHGVPSVILERSDCIASLWQKRTYDRLKLHLPKQFCQLPRFPFPEHYPEYPTKQQFIDYLESYAKHLEISPRFNQSVQLARYDETCGLWRVRTTGTGTAAGSRSQEVEYIGRWLVVATGENAESVVPELDGLREFGGDVMHVCDYKSGEAYRGKRVLVVGCGNSGMEVCLDLCDYDAFPAMVVRDSVHVLPREVLGKSTFELAVLLMKWLPLWLVDKILLVLAWLVLGNIERCGLRRPSTGPLALKNTEGRTPVLDTGALGKIRSGDIKVVPGIKRFSPGKVALVDGQVLDIDSVVLATGYRSNVPQWLQGCEFFSKDGFPKTAFPNGWKGQSGLYAVGFTRRGLSGASSDAVRTAKDIGRMWKEELKPAKRPVACHRRCISQI